MFRTNPDPMRMEATPERVLSVCRLVQNKSMTREEIRNAMMLGNENDKELDQINKSIAVALEELSLIKAVNDKLKLAVDESIIATSKSFRKYVSSIVFLNNDSTFVMFTRWIASKNDEIFKLSRWEVLAKECKKDLPELSGLNENAVLGWRFWAAFLGLGYLCGTMIIPNMATRIMDVLENDFKNSFKYDEAIIATDFVSWLTIKIPEVNFSNGIPLMVSAGLRTLHELEIIKLESWKDTNSIQLFNVDGDLINEFTHILVKEVSSK